VGREFVFSDVLPCAITRRYLHAAAPTQTTIVRHPQPLPEPGLRLDRPFHPRLKRRRMTGHGRVRIARTAGGGHADDGRGGGGRVGLGVGHEQGAWGEGRGSGGALRERERFC